MGAFVVAAQTGVPVLPVALAGTRDVLREGHWLPRRGTRDGDASPRRSRRMAPTGAPPSGCATPRVRAILRDCGEPDLEAGASVRKE